MNKQMIGALLALSLCSCETAQVAARKMRARVTVYNAHEDRFGSRIAMGGRAHEGKTVAAERSIPFGTRVEIPQLNGIIGDGKFVVQDRGSAVNSRKASRHYGMLPVFDVYCATKAKYYWCKANLPPVMDVEIVP